MPDPRQRHFCSFHEPKSAAAQLGFTGDGDSVSVGRRTEPRCKRRPAVRRQVNTALPAAREPEDWMQTTSQFP